MSQNKIVIDHGSYSTKYGFAGYDKPEGSIRSLVIKDGNDYDDAIIDVGESFVKGFDDMEVTYPIKNGIIFDFDGMEKIWDEIIDEKLKVNPNITSVLLTEPIGSKKKSREIVKEIMFEKYGFKQIQFCSQEIVSLYGSGKSTGLVVDIGHDLSRCVPIYDSYIIKSGVQLTNLAGKKFNDHISDRMKFNKYPDELDSYKKNYFKSEGNRLYRNFFIDQLDNIDCPSIPELVSRAISFSDIDLRKDLAKNIVLVGDTSKIPWLSKDILNSVNKVDHLKYKVYAPRNRQHSAWLGGSILSCLPTFDDMWIKKVDY